MSDLLFTIDGSRYYKIEWLEPAQRALLHIPSQCAGHSDELTHPWGAILLLDYAVVWVSGCVLDPISYTHVSSATRASIEPKLPQEGLFILVIAASPSRPRWPQSFGNTDIVSHWQGQRTILYNALLIKQKRQTYKPLFRHSVITEQTLYLI
jgi:hypothetical protein